MQTKIFLNNICEKNAHFPINIFFSLHTTLYFSSKLQRLGLNHFLDVIFCISTVKGVCFWKN